jgi:hypothetical protein
LHSRRPHLRAGGGAGRDDLAPNRALHVSTGGYNLGPGTGQVLHIALGQDA